MILRFPKNEVQKLLDHSLSKHNYKCLYGNTDTCAPGLFLVGDQGICLMSNGIPMLLANGASGKPSSELPAMVVYARECNPSNIPFDQWWSVKCNSFGGDDGIEFLGAEFVHSWIDAHVTNDFLRLEVTTEKIAIAPKSREKLEDRK